MKYKLQFSWKSPTRFAAAPQHQFHYMHFKENIERRKAVVDVPWQRVNKASGQLDTVRLGNLIQQEPDLTVSRKETLITTLAIWVRSTSWTQHIEVNLQFFIF